MTKNKETKSSPPTIPSSLRPTVFVERVLNTITKARPPLPSAQAKVGGKQRWKFALVGWNLAMLLGVGAVIIAAIVIIYNSNLIAPNVQALGFDLGGQSTYNASQTLQDYWQKQSITLESKQTTWTVHPQTLGISLDVEAMVEQAHQQGRSWATSKGILNTKRPITIPPIWQFDESIAHTNLQNLATKFNVAPVEARIKIAEEQATSMPSSVGYRLNVVATIAELAQRIESVITEKKLSLTMQPVQPTITDVSQTVNNLNQHLLNSVTMELYDPIKNERLTWTVPPRVWAMWVVFSPSSTDNTHLSWSLDNQQISTFLNTQNETLDAERFIDIETTITAVQKAITNQTWFLQTRIYYHPRQHTVQSGQTLTSIGQQYGIPYPWLEHANPGVTDALFVGQNITIPSPDDLIPLPIVENKRIKISISQQKMWAYENNTLKWEWPVSTGIDSSPTSPGVFQVQTHHVNAYASNWDLWMPHFMGIYRPVPTSDFMNGFHGFPTRDGRNLLWEANLGHKVTYGCILVDSQNAINLFDWAEQGVIVEVQP